MIEWGLRSVEAPNNVITVGGSSERARRILDALSDKFELVSREVTGWEITE